MFDEMLKFKSILNFKYSPLNQYLMDYAYECAKLIKILKL